MVKNSPRQELRIRSLAKVDNSDNKISQVQQSKRIGGSLMATYVSPAIEQIADYAEATRGWFYGPLRDFIGGRGRIVL